LRLYVESREVKAGDVDADSFGSTISEAGKAIEDAEQRSLAEYIVGGKVVLDFIKILLQKVRDDNALVEMALLNESRVESLWPAACLTTLPSSEGAFIHN
jgi:hypothetical protein